MDLDLSTTVCDYNSSHHNLLILPTLSFITFKKLLNDMLYISVGEIVPELLEFCHLLLFHASFTSIFSNQL